MDAFGAALAIVMVFFQGNIYAGEIGKIMLVGFRLGAVALGLRRVEAHKPAGSSKSEQ
jgi:hypothetical protein